jgi:hypothetical protein
MNRTKTSTLFFMILAWLLFYPTAAYAYIDPGTGSMVIQAIFAVIAATGIYIGLCWKKTKSFFRQLLGKNKKTDEDGHED